MSLGPPDEPLGEELLRLTSADNFRDLSGPGHRTADGRALRPALVYRSNELALTDEDAARVADLGVTSILDLRHADEIALHPDTSVPGAAWEHLEIPGIPMEDVATLEAPERAEEVMREVYRGFVRHPGARAAFATLIGRLATAEAPLVFHCTAGKDRTGWAAVLVLGICGVPDEVVLDDYLATNRVSIRTREKYLGMVREHLGDDKVEVYERVMVADERYLAAALEAIRSDFGTLAGYLGAGLGLTDATLDALRMRLVVE
ncbi:MAG TPA: tyrosine-protein phosphatase [Nocardioides sp.]|nr:tyrosine-protein phosphatase [Nocardioides sp.]